MGDAMLMTLDALVQAVQGTVLYSGRKAQAGFSSVAIDSRKVTEAGLFVALPGSSQDGHQYIDNAFNSGASIVLMQEDRLEAYRNRALSAAQLHDGALIVVPKTLLALQQAARAYIDEFPGLLKIGITGSSGKTTVKELTAAIMGQEKRVIMNEGNLNSETGLPLSVFSVRPEHQVGVFEMGMNRPGEIGELAAVLRPDIALITNIGTAHIGILGSKDAIAEEKKAIFSQFNGKQVGLIPEYDAYADFLQHSVQGHIKLYGPRTTAPFGGGRNLGLDGIEFIWNQKSITIPLAGQHNLLNALAAAALAQEAGAGAEAIQRGLASVKPLFGRGEIFKGPVTLIRDCYNANPESTIAAIEFCDELEWSGRRIYVIGSMLELGSESELEHQRVARVLAHSKADIIYLFGAETACMQDLIAETGTHQVLHTTDMDLLKRTLAESLVQGDLVLLKGSRGVALERLTDIVKNQGV
ncbi:UDP-N-acetylmuramoyl-tripeptide--D-alanyl-D-alanine ligase [Gracilinema caldarium]|uniref:UDP-N-acetylmuramoyl-tripeptide--D-alanyl-D- alanine ligase n=1 Tax=Gracilinema caldarium TaxID=215591 RepID=UPI0026F357A5|nr:UDP-N-acetylmuramoyl-tripeptide--D-alanyl-D-alanine ligase [Gracilinema caldarium]